MIFVAPGVEVRVNDLSAYAPYLSSTIVGMVGKGSWGPTNDRELISTEAKLINKFGVPTSDHLGLLAAIRYLRYGKQLWYVRVANYDQYADVNLPEDGGTGTSVVVTAVYTGTEGNNLRIRVSAGSKGGDYYKIQVYHIIATATVLEETFDNVLVGSSYSGNSNFIETRINGVSEFISVEDQNLGSLDPINTYTMAGGDDGLDVTDQDIVGLHAGNTRTGMQLFANPADLDLNLICAPGLEDDAVVSGLALAAEARGDCMWIANPSAGLTVEEAVAWINGEGTGVGDPGSLINDWRGAAYYPWASCFNGYSNSYITIPTTGHVAGVYAYTDEVADPWFAPAGPRRGLLKDVSELEYNVDQGEHEFMCPTSGGPGQNNLNPIRSIPGEGVQIYSQKTLFRYSTSRRDVNVVRMLLYAMKVVASAVSYLKFEPNDAFTWREFERIVNPILEGIKGRRGLYNYTVQCEKYMLQNPDLVNNNTMYGQLFLQPTRAAEIIVADFNLLPYGATFEVA